MINGRTPVLIGAGQISRKSFDPPEQTDPVGMMLETIRLAAEDAGAGSNLLARLDSVNCVGLMGWNYRNLPGLLSEKLGIRPREEIVTGVGGNSPQMLVNLVARKIAEGRIEAAVLTGAESMYTLRRTIQAGRRPPWASGGLGQPTYIGELTPGVNETETVYGLDRPVVIYPLFENAWRARHRLDLATHRRRMGTLFSRFTEIAAANPHAWFQTTLSPEELTTVTPENRMICFPYPKRLNSILDVNQAASVIMTSLETARALHVPEDRFVYLWGGGDAVEDPWFISERPNFFSCRAMGQAARAALHEAGVSVQNLNYIDLYSCFPCAVSIACDMLNIGRDDPRPLTVTGGLPYAGGPGNNYSMHAIAAMMPKLRAAPGTMGLITANGYYLTKHSAGVYSAVPQETGSDDTASFHESAPPEAPPRITHEAEGQAWIETFTVMHNREGEPEKGIIIGRLDDNRRFIANTPGDRALLEGLEKEESVGRTGRVTTRDGLLSFEPD